MALPKVILVAERKDGDESYFVACSDVNEAIEDDGPTVVGTYKLVGTRRMVKRPTEIKR